MATYEQIFAIALANEMHAAAASMDLDYIRWLCAVDARRVAGEWAAVTNTLHDERFIEAVREETVKARRLYERQGWPVIDVTRRSVEETAAAVLNLLHGGHGQVEVLG